MIKSSNIPTHVAIIMDGNGRWAEARHLPKIAGHREGAKSVDAVTEAAREMGIKYLTLYAFSTENWKRPMNEVEGLFKLLEQNLDDNEEKLNKNNIRLEMIGDKAALPKSTSEKLLRVISSTAKNDGMTLILAINYGSRAEIAYACREIAQKAQRGEIKVSAIDEEVISDALYTAGIPDPDLLIRTSGQSRVSNFLLWQISYTEIYITDKMWPDFRKDDLIKVVGEYQKRERRYGG